MRDLLVGEMGNMQADWLVLSSVYYVRIYIHVYTHPSGSFSWSGLHETFDKTARVTHKTRFMQYPILLSPLVRLRMDVVHTQRKKGSGASHSQTQDGKVLSSRLVSEVFTNLLCMIEKEQVNAYIHMHICMHIINLVISECQRCNLTKI